jgi:cytochrome c553
MWPGGATRLPVLRSWLGITLILLCCSIAPVRAQVRPASEFASRAMAATPDVTRGADLFQRFCKSCHSSRGSGEGDREFARLAGQQSRYILNQLAQFISLGRYGPRMHQVLTQVADPQSLADLSAYLALQPRDSLGEHGDGHRLGRGRSLYNEHCAQCHGLLGEGQSEGPIPAIGSQNYTYLLTQLKGFAAGHRAQAEGNLIAVVSSLSANDMRAVADFMSRMPQSVDPHYGVVY